MLRVDLADLRKEQLGYEASIQHVFKLEGWRIEPGSDSGQTMIMGGPYSGPEIGVSCHASSVVGRAILARLPRLGIDCIRDYKPDWQDEVPIDLYLRLGRSSSE